MTKGVPRGFRPPSTVSRGFRPPSTVSRGFRPPATVSKSAVYIYLRSNPTAGVPGSTFFIGFNPDVREIVYSVEYLFVSRVLNKIEILFRIYPIHQRTQSTTNK